MSLILMDETKQAIASYLQPNRPVTLPAYAGGATLRYEDVARMSDQKLDDKWMGRVYQEPVPLLIYQVRVPGDVIHQVPSWLQQATAQDLEPEDALRQASNWMESHFHAVREGGVIVNGAGTFYVTSDAAADIAVSLVGSAIALGEPYPTNGIPWLVYVEAQSKTVRKKLNQTEFSALAKALARHEIKSRDAFSDHLDALDALTTTPEIRDYMDNESLTLWPPNPPVLPTL